MCIRALASLFTHHLVALRAQARHTGIKIVQQIAILLGCGVLPHLKALVDIVKHGLTDENQKVRAQTTFTFDRLREDPLLPLLSRGTYRTRHACQTSCLLPFAIHRGCTSINSSSKRCFVVVRWVTR